jgi:hypothetical protein
VIAEYNILPKNKYNMDESAYAISEIQQSNALSMPTFDSNFKANLAVKGG